MSNRSEIHQIADAARTPVAWLASACGATWGLWAYGSAGAGLGAFLGLSLALLATIDLRTHTLPNLLTLPLLAVGLIAAPGNGHSWLAALLGAVAGGGAFLFLSMGFKAITGKDGMGMGDVKLMAALGAWVGLVGLLPLILVASWGQVALHVALGKKRLPFGPFLAGAGALTYALLPPLSVHLAPLFLPS